MSHVMINMYLAGQLLHTSRVLTFDSPWTGQRISDSISAALCKRRAHYCNQKYRNRNLPT
jgi:hypothetical protein